VPAAIDYPGLAQDAFNRRDLAALSALWSEDFHYLAPGEETRGREAALRRERGLFEAFPDLRADLSRNFAAGERLVIEGVLRGTHQGRLRLGDVELAPSGRAVVIEFTAVFLFADGVVREERVAFDRLGLLAQLGIAAAGAAR